MFNFDENIILLFILLFIFISGELNTTQILLILALLSTEFSFGNLCRKRCHDDCDDR